MPVIKSRRFLSTAKHAGCVALASFALAASPSLLSAQSKVVGAVPGAVTHATSKGPIAPDKDLSLTIWLEMPNRAAFDKKVEDLYTPGSSSFHKWLSTDELLSYAPADAEVKLVKKALGEYGLTVVEDGRDNYSIKVHAPAAVVQTAFSTRIEEFEKAGTTFHANTIEAKVTGEAAKYVAGVSGLSNIPMRPQIARAINPKTKQPIAPVPLAKVQAASGGLSSAFTDQCFPGTQTFTFGAPNTLPTGVYFGNVYAPGPQSCGYTASQMQAAYQLPAVYKAGLQGQGQSIVIIDAYGSPTIESDANEFNKLNGLPALNSSNFQIIYPDGKPLDPALGGGWIGETSLDVEWSHAIAPKAKIVLLAAASQDDEDFQYAVYYATIHKLGSVISNSYGVPEIEHGPITLDAYNLVIQMAAASGISVNYSTGDSGDLGLGTPVGAASTPADSPYATAVGGTSLNVPGGSGPAKEVGWGNNETELAFASGTYVDDPPFNFGNYAGAGGGESVYFAKPSWQSKLPGKYRLLPDVALDADPFSGAVVIYTDPNLGPIVEAIGGTSLSCPMFSAYWALANQKAGHLLGQAAPIISKLPAGALNDIVPGSSPTNVSGFIVDGSGPTFYSAAALSAPLEGTSTFTSAVWPIQGFYYNLTFGTDTSLMTAKGWDDVTGYGTPAGLAFIDAAAKE